MVKSPQVAVIVADGDLHIPAADEYLHISVTVNIPGGGARADPFTGIERPSLGAVAVQTTQEIAVTAKYLLLAVSVYIGGAGR